MKGLSPEAYVLRITGEILLGLHYTRFGLRSKNTEVSKLQRLAGINEMNKDGLKGKIL